MLYVEPLKSKSAKDVYSGIKTIIERMERKVKSVYSDNGKEFVNTTLKKYLDSMNIKQFTTLSDQKACRAERSIRQIKNHINKFFTARNTRKYIDNLQSITKNINDTPNRVIGMPPSEVNKYNEMLVFRRSTLGIMNKPKNLFEVGTDVRISLLRNVFAKEHVGNFSKQIFKIVSVDTRISPEVYRLEDFNKQPIKGIFYRQELVAVTPPEKYQVEILERKGNKYRVHWVGYPPEFDSWVLKKDLGAI